MKKGEKNTEGNSGSSPKLDRRTGKLPTHLVALTTLLVGAAIIGSALFTFLTLQRLRVSYLSNRGHEIAAAIEMQARGPGRRSNPDFWQTLLNSSHEAHSRSVRYMALVDQEGNTLASSGTPEPDAYIFEEPLGRPRGRHRDMSPTPSGWRIRIGLDWSETDFIRRQASLQLTVSALSLIALVGLSIALVRMLNKFFDLQAREAAETQLRSLGVMSASLAHEIRNPLGSIKGLTQLAQEELPPDHAAHPQLRTVVSETERLERLVSDLLDFAKPRTPDIREFDLGTLISEIREMLDPRVQMARITLHLAIASQPFIVRSDPAGLRQVLLNVLINAIDATPENGEIALSAEWRDGRRAMIIAIDDSGPGLAGRNPEDLFRPFATTKTRGTGLGLAISRQIVENLGGTLVLENSPRGGARCSMMLPMKEPGA